MKKLFIILSILFCSSVLYADDLNDFLNSAVNGYQRGADSDSYYRQQQLEMEREQMMIMERQARAQEEQARLMREEEMRRNRIKW